MKRKTRVLPRTLLGDKLLRSHARQVTKSEMLTPEFQQLIRDMFYSLRRIGGVGLAAPQVGVGKRVAIISINPKDVRATHKKHIKITMINPKIIASSKKTIKMYEGCLSFMDLYGEVERPSQIDVEYRDKTGSLIKKRLSGLTARVFQHELDHLDGIVWIDKTNKTRSFMTRQFYLLKKKQMAAKKKKMETDAKNRLRDQQQKQS